MVRRVLRLLAQFQKERGGLDGLFVNTTCVDRILIDHALQGTPIAIGVIRTIRAVDASLIEFFT